MRRFDFQPQPQTQTRGLNRDARPGMKGSEVADSQRRHRVIRPPQSSKVGIISGGLGKKGGYGRFGVAMRLRSTRRAIQTVLFVGRPSAAEGNGSTIGDVCGRWRSPGACLGLAETVPRIGGPRGVTTGESPRNRRQHEHSVWRPAHRSAGRAPGNSSNDLAQTSSVFFLSW